VRGGAGRSSLRRDQGRARVVAFIPSGEHRYRFTVVALDAPTGLTERANLDDAARHGGRPRRFPGDQSVRSTRATDAASYRQKTAWQSLHAIRHPDVRRGS
jgi:phosphatidylethanolamine-binding protein (PEBP) family uncharacterized protein